MKKKRLEWPDDPVVAEVRAIREKLWKEAGGTFEGLRRLLDREVPMVRGRKMTKRRARKRTG